jgi:uncharacterized protein YerC
MLGEHVVPLGWLERLLFVRNTSHASLVFIFIFYCALRLVSGCVVWLDPRVRRLSLPPITCRFDNYMDCGSVNRCLYQRLRERQPLLLPKIAGASIAASTTTFGSVNRCFYQRLRERQSLLLPQPSGASTAASTKDCGSVNRCFYHNLRERQSLLLPKDCGSVNRCFYHNLRERQSLLLPKIAGASTAASTKDCGSVNRCFYHTVRERQPLLLPKIAGASIAASTTTFGSVNRCFYHNVRKRQSPLRQKLQPLMRITSPPRPPTAAMMRRNTRMRWEQRVWRRMLTLPQVLR